MPLKALSLYGFMEEPAAILYLQNGCVTSTSDVAALKNQWSAARAKLGAPIAKAGDPEVLHLPSAHAAHVAQVKTTWPMIVSEGWEIRLVEVDPLLAYQLHVSLAHSDGHCAKNGGPPTFSELLSVCLPATPPPMRNPFSSVQGQSIIIRSEDLNVRLLMQGVTGPGQFGIIVGPGLPLVQVVRCNGRCYLRNGFHRAYGMRRRGAKHVPCIYKENDDFNFLGLREDGSTFGRALMESADPPTVGHLTQDRATEVDMRKASRILQVSWSEHVLFDE